MLESAVDPRMDVWQRGDGDVRGQNVQNGSGTIMIGRPWSDFQRGTGSLRQTLPRIVVGRELLVEHENALAFFYRQISRCCRYAVAGRRNDGDAVGRAVWNLVWC